MRDETAAQPTQADPPGVARVLSLGDESMLEGMSDLDNAVNCAAALKVTLEAVNALASGNDAREVRALAEIERIYRGRALAAAEAAGRSSTSAVSAIERQVLIGSRSEHGQLAMACLKSFEAPTG